MRTLNIEPVYMTLGARLRMLRSLHKETLADVAKVIGIHLVGVSLYETGGRRIQLHQLVLLAAHYGVSIDGLLDLRARRAR